MKTRTIFALLLWSLLLPLPASAFYNPQAGRWLSRDRIAERGGLNLYGFVKASPINFIDPVGEVAIPPVVLFCRYCDGKQYNWVYECCCNGKVVSKREIDSGVVSHKWEENPGRAGRYHVWLTWDGGSIDSNANELSRPPGAAGDKLIHSPANMPSPNTASPVKLSPCEYDFKKLAACLSRKAIELEGQEGGICSDFARNILETCKSESKGCTAP